jgi:LysM repeat protein
MTIRTDFSSFLAVIVAAMMLVPSAHGQQNPCGEEVTVRAGDTLHRIAERCATTVEALLAANEDIVNPDLIRTGQVLKMPGPAFRGRTETVREDRAVPTPGVEYVVREHDTLFGIAQYHGTTISELRRLNPRLADPDVMEPGTRLRIPAPREASGTPHYVVREADTLPGIAEYHHTTVSELRALNPQVVDPAALAAGDALLLAGDTLTIEGRITDEGVTCPALRDDEGTLFTLAGVQEVPAEGTRVRITGTLPEMSVCMQGITIGVERMERTETPNSPR